MTGKQMKKIITAMIICLACFLMYSNALAGCSTEDSCQVIIYGLNGDRQMESYQQGFLLDVNGSSVVLSGTEMGECMYYVVLNQNEDMIEAVCDAYDTTAGVSIFKLDEYCGGFPINDVADLSDVKEGDKIHSKGFDYYGEEEALADLIRENTSTVYDIVNRDEYDYIRIQDYFDQMYAGSPVFLENGKLAGIFSSKGTDMIFAMSNIVSSGSDEVEGTSSSHPMKSPLFMILWFGGIIAFAGSTIAYNITQKKKKKQGKEEFTIAKPKENHSRPTLQVRGTSGIYRGKTFSPDAGAIVFGRDESQCIVLYTKETKGISRVHCRVEWVKDSLMITDMGSTCGTFLNDGTPLTTQLPVELHRGDTFYLADKNNAFVIE